MPVIYVSESVHEELKNSALAFGLSMRALTETAVLKFIAENIEEARRNFEARAAETQKRIERWNTESERRWAADGLAGFKAETGQGCVEVPLEDVRVHLEKRYRKEVLGRAIGQMTEFPPADDSEKYETYKDGLAELVEELNELDEEERKDGGWRTATGELDDTTMRRLGWKGGRPKYGSGARIIIR